MVIDSRRIEVCVLRTFEEGEREEGKKKKKEKNKEERKNERSVIRAI